MNCPNCGAPGRLERDHGVFVCDYCRAELVPPSGDDGVHVFGHTKLRCPGCEDILLEGRIESCQLWYCQSCRGTLVSMGHFQGLIEVLRARRDRPSVVLAPRGAESAKLPRICPQCSGAMENHSYGGPGNVWMDTCEPCSLNWLDKGELRKIAGAPDPRSFASLYSE